MYYFFYYTFFWFEHKFENILYKIFGMTQSSLVPNLSFFLEFNMHKYFSRSWYYVIDAHMVYNRTLTKSFYWLGIHCFVFWVFSYLFLSCYRRLSCHHQPGTRCLGVFRSFKSETSSHWRTLTVCQTVWQSFCIRLSWSASSSVCILHG